MNEMTLTAQETTEFTLPAESPDSPEASRWRDKLLTFHLAGGDPHASPLPQPAVVKRINDLKFPIHLSAGESPAISSLADLLPSPAMDALACSFRDLAARTGSIPMAAAREQIGAGNVPSPLPSEGVLLPADAAALPVLHGALLASARRPARQRLAAEVTRLRSRLRDLLAVDDSHTPQAKSPEAVASTFGAEGRLFFDATSLSAALRKPIAPPRMEPERRRRIEEALAALELYLRDARDGPAFWVLLPEQEISAQPGIAAAGGCAIPNGDGVSGVLRFSDRILHQMAALFRAIRTARLESEGAFHPETHEERLQRFDWRGATGDELAAVPVVVACQSAASLAATRLDDLARLLRSGRPVQILVIDDGDWDPASPDLASLAIAHQDALVACSSLTETAHLNGCLAAMAAATRPALALLSVHPSPLPPFLYHPDSGTSFSAHFRLLHESAEAPWKSVTLSAAREGGGLFEWKDAVTPAHAAAMLPQYRGHFQVIPPRAWDPSQAELTAFLEQPASEGLPYIWLADSNGLLQRALVTAGLVDLCRRHLQSWKTLRDMAGEASAAQLRKELEASSAAAARQARQEGAREAIQRLVAALMSRESLPASLLATPLPPRPAPQPQAQPQPQPQPQAQTQPAKPQEPSPAADPYIDSYLCTSCNDCMKVNARLFLYDGNKQAYISDPKLGAFADLVKAAEGCPAKCIHPGAPRPGDTTATPQLIAKAAKFN
ncbi:MAG: ferredoxin [Bryobacterales bacterium]|nr:ferredoxin [Bryobacterales bacterium]